MTTGSANGWKPRRAATSSSAGAPKAVTNSPSPTRPEPLASSPSNISDRERSPGAAGDNSFPRHNRLRGRSNFLKVTGQGERRRGRWCEILFAERNDGESGTSFGIVVTSKAGNSVRRNRLKRIIREYLRTHKNVWPQNKMVMIRIKTSVGDEGGLIAEIDDMLKG
jgi:ribonuclease P protein component